jgi:hypothetical protein
MDGSYVVIEWGRLVRSKNLLARDAKRVWVRGLIASRSCSPGAPASGRYMLPTGHACALEHAPASALGMALHALTLLA